MNIKVDFDNIVVKEDKNDFNVKVLMLKGEKGEAGATSWGAITGTLSSQTDLKNALNGKANQTDFNTVSGQVNTNTSNISTINGQITDINGELDDFEDLFYGNATVNDENTSITLENTVEAKFESFDLKGNTSQNGTPTPSNPIPVNVVSGDNEIIIVNEDNTDSNTYNIDLPVENLVNIGTGSSSRNNTTLTVTDNIINLKNTGATSYGAYGIDNSLRNSNYGDYISWGNQTLKAGTYTISCKYLNGNNSSTQTGSNFVRLYVYGRSVGDTGRVGTELAYCDITNSSTSKTFTINEDKEINVAIYMCAYNITIDINFHVQLEVGSHANQYTPYGTTPIELCKIGNYQDYFYKDNGNWYKYGAITKVKLSDLSWTSQTWGYQATTDLSNIIKPANTNATAILLCNVYAACTPNNAYGLSGNVEHGITMYGNSVMVRETTITSLNDFNNMVANAYVYLLNIEATTTQITDTTLISQLNAIEQATSKNGETNISQINNDLPFIIYAEAFANTFNGRMEGMNYKIDECEKLSNKVATITSSSTNAQYPSAKAVYDLFNSITDGDEVSY